MSQQSKSHNGSSNRVLIVEDEPIIRKMIAKEFANLNWTVFEASGAFEAHAILENQKVELIVSDVRMPKGSGVHLLEALKLMPNQNPVIVLVSGHTEIIEYQAFKLGASAIFTKPFASKDLIERILEVYSDETKLRAG